MQHVLLIGGHGYIGSALASSLHIPNTQIDILDNGTYDHFLFEQPKCHTHFYDNFQNKDKSFYEQYDVIILLAGLSSVAMCKNAPKQAFEENVIDFYNLINKLEPTQKFIYASSSSIYNGASYEATEEYGEFKITNPYDFTKYTIDGIAKLYGTNYYGLRFGTVCGKSLNFRTDIMINKMVYNAIHWDEISVYNPLIKRPILGMKDLQRAISAIIMSDDKPGIYNLKSVNEHVYKIAQTVGFLTDKPVRIKGSSETYNFEISSKLFEAMFNFEFKSTIEDITLEIIDLFDTRGIRLNERI